MKYKNKSMVLRIQDLISSVSRPAPGTLKAVQSVSAEVSKRPSLNLKSDKTYAPFQEDRGKGEDGIPNLIDGLSRRIHRERMKFVLQERFIEKHKLAERRMFLYNNPKTGGLQPDILVEILEKENEQEKQRNEEEAEKRAQQENQSLVQKQIEVVRQERKDKFDLLNHMNQLF